MKSKYLIKIKKISLIQYLDDLEQTQWWKSEKLKDYKNDMMKVHREKITEDVLIKLPNLKDALIKLQNLEEKAVSIDEARTYINALTNAQKFIPYESIKIDKNQPINTTHLFKKLNSLKGFREFITQDEKLTDQFNELLNTHMPKEKMVVLIKNGVCGPRLSKNIEILKDRKPKQKISEKHRILSAKKSLLSSKVSTKILDLMLNDMKKFAKEKGHQIDDKQNLLVYCLDTLEEVKWKNPEKAKKKISKYKKNQIGPSILKPAELVYEPKSLKGRVNVIELEGKKYDRTNLVHRGAHKLVTVFKSVTDSGVFKIGQVTMRPDADPEQARKSLDRERLFLNIVEGCENLIQCHKISHEDQEVLALEYYEGGTVTNYLQQDNLDPSIKDRITLDILKGLQQLRSKGIVHRDLHPENIMIKLNEKGEYEKAVIVDLGEAHLYDPNDNKPKSKQVNKALLSPNALNIYIDPKTPQYDDLLNHAFTQNTHYSEDYWVTALTLAKIFLGDKGMRKISQDKDVGNKAIFELLDKEEKKIEENIEKFSDQKQQSKMGIAQKFPYQMAFEVMFSKKETIKTDDGKEEIQIVMNQRDLNTMNKLQEKSVQTTDMILRQLKDQKCPKEIIDTISTLFNAYHNHNFKIDDAISKVSKVEAL